MPVHRQTGVALLTVLLVVFLASVAATGLASVQQLAIRRSTLVLHQQQAQLYALGGEQWAAAILIRDLKENQTDHLNETWATLPPALPVEGGSLAGNIQDLQGRFNINNLLKPDRRTIDDGWLEILRRLLIALELDPGIAEAIADWIDPDMEPRGLYGAEDGEYVGRTPPYLAANRPLVSISELRLIKGMDEESFDRLAPYVCALPNATPINVNTAPAPVLASLFHEPSLIKAEALIEGREPEGYPDVNTFLDMAQLSEGDLPQPSLADNSSYFLIRIEANVGEGRAIVNSILQRDGTGGAHILTHSFGTDEP